MGIGGKKGITVATSGWMNQRPLVYRGEWIGLWDWDIDTAELIVAGFEAATPQSIEACALTCARLRPLIGDDLEGRARAISVDGPGAQRKRAAAVRALHAETAQG